MLTKTSTIALLACLAACSGKPEAQPTQLPSAAPRGSLEPLFPAPPAGRRYATDRTALSRIVLELCPNGSLYLHEREGKRSGRYELRGHSVDVHYDDGDKGSESYELTSDLGAMTLPGKPFVRYQGEAKCDGEAIDE